LSRVLLEKLSCSQLVKKFLAFYGTRRFITAFKSARHLSVSWAESIQSMLPLHPTLFLKIFSSNSYHIVDWEEKCQKLGVKSSTYGHMRNSDNIISENLQVELDVEVRITLKPIVLM
jgi:hypothetical protein